ncbi:hypothetical protein GRI89_16220 [Altererythrobacter salegens]|uniref:VOC domain-containing protein n=1 Tax=Croceibacterium salegens TaxID=1737568 RepID=A0A6I4T0F4_9SPHN|nr:VOC family protein [Croceibacterium salegens]MXO61089.1 hypothetical protein [Croceibacterium salegens]
MTAIKTLALGLALTASAPASAQQEARMAAPIVFFDIAGPDGSAVQAFYTAVFGWKVAADGAVTVETTGRLDGNLRTEAAGDAMLYFGVPDVTAALAKVTANGGSVEAPRFEVPGVVILGLFRDPAGNRMGLVEIGEDGRAIVP